MAPFHMPWSTFGAFLVLDFTVVLAIAWALYDRRQDREASE